MQEKVFPSFNPSFFSLKMYVLIALERAENFEKYCEETKMIYIVLLAGVVLILRKKRGRSCYVNLVTNRVIGALREQVKNSSAGSKNALNRMSAIVN